jgi:hypothetical protein
MEAKETKTVYEKILAVMGSVNYLNKDGFVETGKGKGYKALTDEKVLGAVRPALVSAGLVILPVKMEQQRTDEQVKAYDGSTKTNRITDVSVTYRIINVEDPKDYVEVVSAGTGVDTQDKGIGKAMTYAKKYAILNSFLIPSGEDTDQISSDKYTEQLMGPAPAPAPDQVPAQQSDREITIKTIITLAERYGKKSLINDTGYNGRPWNFLTDDELKRLKLWIVAVGKKAGAA